MYYPLLNWVSSGYVYSRLQFISWIMSFSGDVIEVDMQVGMQYEHAGGHMQDNHNTVLCIYSNDVCKVYRKQNRCNVEHAYEIT